MGYRTALVKALQQKFPDYGLTYSIGGQISIDIFPIGWDKTYSLGRVADEHFDEIHFFGDKTYEVGFQPFHLLFLTNMWDRVEMIMKYSAILELLDILLPIPITQCRLLKSSSSRIDFSLRTSVGYQLVKFTSRIDVYEHVENRQVYINNQPKRSKYRVSSSQVDLDWNAFRVPLPLVHKRQRIPGEEPIYTTFLLPWKKTSL